MQSARESKGRNESKPATNSTYAQALRKGNDSSSNDASNNNPMVGDESNANLTSTPIREDNSSFHTPDSSSDSEENQSDSSQPSSVKAQNLKTESDSEADSITLELNRSASTGETESDSEASKANVSSEKLKMEDLLSKLPPTVTFLEDENGAKVYVVGTAHFSTESQEDVSKTITAVVPDVVMLELCKTRINILALDEKFILEEASRLNLQKVRQEIQQNGVLQGVLYCLLLSMSAHLTKELGMPPGGEFRRAFEEAKKVPGCVVHLGDRPIQITLQRALATLSMWQKVKIAWHMLRSREKITREDVERCKQKDLLEQMLSEMTGEFPQLTQVFLTERDSYLAWSLRVAASHVQRNQTGTRPSTVVGVVGIGHVPGIVQCWKKVTDEDIGPLLHVPEATLGSKIMKNAFKASILVATAYGVYRLFPRTLVPPKLRHFF